MTTTKINFMTPDGQYIVFTTMGESPTILRVNLSYKGGDLHAFSEDEYDIYRLARDLKDCPLTVYILNNIKAYKLKKDTMEQEIEFITPDKKFKVYTTENEINTTLRLDPIDPKETFHVFHSDLYDIQKLAKDFENWYSSDYILRNIYMYKLKRDSGKLPVLPTAAHDLLEKGAALLKERGKQYDKSGSERSMKKIVEAFNTITGKNLTVTEGWYFMTILKGVRFFSNPENVHRDSLEDLISYAALMAEEALGGN